MPEPIYSLEQFLGAPLRASVTLSSADILDLHNTPVTLVAAPGAGKWVSLHRVMTVKSSGSTEYVYGSALVLGLGDDPNNSPYYFYDQTVGSDLSTTEPRVSYMGMPQMYGFQLTSVDQLDDQPLRVGATAFGPITDGDSVLTIYVWYSIEDLN